MCDRKQCERSGRSYRPPVSTGPGLLAAFTPNEARLGSQWFVRGGLGGIALVVVDNPPRCRVPVLC